MTVEVNFIRNFVYSLVRLIPCIPNKVVQKLELNKFCNMELQQTLIQNMAILTQQEIR